MAELDGHPGEWLPLADAAPRLGLTVDALRKQVKRGRREGRRDNHGQWLVQVVRDGQPARAGRTRHPNRTDGLAVELAKAQAELDMSRAAVARLDTDVVDLRAELARERNHVDDLRAEVSSLRTERDAARIEAAELRGRLAEATRPGPMARLIGALTARLTGRGGDRH